MHLIVMKIDPSINVRHWSCVQARKLLTILRALRSTRRGFCLGLKLALRRFKRHESEFRSLRTYNATSHDITVSIGQAELSPNAASPPLQLPGGWSYRALKK